MPVVVSAFLALAGCAATGVRLVPDGIAAYVATRRAVLGQTRGNLQISDLIYWL